MTFADFVYQFKTLFNVVMGALAAIALLLFFVGLVRVLYVGSSEVKKLQEAKSLLLWGIISLFVIFAMGGILNFFAQDIFGKTVLTSGSSQAHDACISTVDGVGCVM